MKIVIYKSFFLNKDNISISLICNENLLLVISLYFTMFPNQGGSPEPDILTKCGETNNLVCTKNIAEQSSTVIVQYTSCRAVPCVLCSVLCAVCSV